MVKYPFGVQKLLHYMIQHEGGRVQVTIPTRTVPTSTIPTSTIPTSTIPTRTVPAEA